MVAAANTEVHDGRHTLPSEPQENGDASQAQTVTSPLVATAGFGSMSAPTATQQLAQETICAAEEGATYREMRVATEPTERAAASGEPGGPVADAHRSVSAAPTRSTAAGIGAVVNVAPAQAQSLSIFSAEGALSPSLLQCALQLRHAQPAILSTVQLAEAARKSIAARFWQLGSQVLAPMTRVAQSLGAAKEQIEERLREEYAFAMLVGRNAYYALSTDVLVDPQRQLLPVCSG